MDMCAVHRCTALHACARTPQSPQRPFCSKYLGITCAAFLLLAVSRHGQMQQRATHITTCAGLLHGDGGNNSTLFAEYNAAKKTVQQLEQYMAAMKDNASFASLQWHRQHARAQRRQKIRFTICSQCKPGEDATSNGGCKSWCSSSGLCGRTPAYQHHDCQPAASAPPAPPLPMAQAEDALLAAKNRVERVHQQLWARRQFHRTVMFRPGTLDVVITYYNQSARLDTIAKAEEAVMWTLRGLATHWGMHARRGNSSGLVRHVYILYNTLEGNGPPSFVNWVKNDDPLYRTTRAGCKDQVYSSAANGVPTLFAIPHCLTFPPESNPPGRTRAASQLQGHRIPGVSEVFMNIEDDMIPTRPFQRSEWIDGKGRLKSHLDWDRRICTDCWMRNQLTTVDRLGKKCGATRLRNGGAQHNPWLTVRGLMYDIEDTWPVDFNYTVGATTSGVRGSTIEPITMTQNYAIDRGFAVEMGRYKNMAGIHTNEASLLAAEANDVSALRSTFLEVFPVAGRQNDAAGDAFRRSDRWPSLVNIQGPGWSSEYSSRKEYRCFIVALLRSLLPAPSPWETAAWVAWLEAWQNTTCSAFAGVKLA